MPYFSLSAQEAEGDAQGDREEAVLSVLQSSSQLSLFIRMLHLNGSRQGETSNRQEMTLH